MADESGAQSFTRWQADSWDDLASIWSSLVPESEHFDGQIVRSFRSVELGPQQAGAVFETWVLEAFRLSGADVFPPYTSRLKTGLQSKEQIDGLVISDWQGLLIESKFWPEHKVDFGPIALMHVRVEQRPASTLGLFFAPFGYSPAALESASELRPLRVLLFDRSDLDWGLNQHNMMNAVREKWRMAVKFGRPNMSVVESESLSGERANGTRS